MPQDRKTELKAALLTILLLSIVYVVYAQITTPRASSLFGHGIGVVGFTLMLATETLYSLRKRTRLIQWGRMSQWLAVHIYMGIVGPYMVLLHSAWKFAGLAGITMLLTAIVVASGFIGRYIYTTVHRSLAGAELREEELQAELNALNQHIQQRLSEQPQAVRQAIQQLIQSHPLPEEAGASVLFLRMWDNLTYRMELRRIRSLLPPSEQTTIRELQQLLLKQRALRMQTMTLGVARGLLGLWHTIHVPLGLALFTSAFLHSLFALYYATLSW